MRKIETRPIKNTDISLPGSKSYTHRMLIAAALTNGWCRIHNPLESEDTNYTRQALTGLGAKVEKADAYIDIKGTGGGFQPVDEPIDMGNSGTSMRLLAGVVALGPGSYELTGTDRMKQRPIEHLLDALRQLGIEAVAINGNGCPPIRVSGGKIAGGEVKMDCSISSQFLSSLLLMAPLTANGLSIQVVKGPVSKPYIDMTVDVLNQFGIQVQRKGYTDFDVKGGQTYQAGKYTVEPDASQAGYFWAAAAITGARIQVRNLFRSSLQGDVKFVYLLEQMGCRVEDAPAGLAVTGGALSAIDVDMADMPDLVPTLAVVAAFAKGQTVIRNVGHLRDKESDRLSAVQNELNKIDISADTQGEDLIIAGGHPRGAEIETYNDHRMAMSFAVAGLRTPGIFIKNEGCVAKSFPGFWKTFDRMYA